MYSTHYRPIRLLQCYQHPRLPILNMMDERCSYNLRPYIHFIAMPVDYELRIPWLPALPLSLPISRAASTTAWSSLYCG